MVRQTKKYIEAGMRKAAEKAGNKGRSMTYEAIGRATDCSSEIVTMFLEMVEKEMPYPRGAGSRILPEHVQQVYYKFRAIFDVGIRQVEIGGEEE